VVSGSNKEEEEVSGSGKEEDEEQLCLKVEYLRARLDNTKKEVEISAKFLSDYQKIHDESIKALVRERAEYAEIRERLTLVQREVDSI
jgi:hypothetical protein